MNGSLNEGRPLNEHWYALIVANQLRAIDLEGHHRAQTCYSYINDYRGYSEATTNYKIILSTKLSHYTGIII